MEGVREIHQKLDDFTKKYYSNKLIKGILFLIGFVGSVYVVLAFSEYFGHFSISVRTVFALLFVVSITWFSFYWVLIPILAIFKIGRRLTFDRIERLLQSYFPEIKDQLKNTLELEKMYSNVVSIELLKAAIEQKASALKLIPFSQAISYRKNYRLASWISVPILFILTLYLFSPKVLSESTNRLVNYQTHFEAPANFAFVIENTDLSVRRGQDLTIELHTQGKYIPNPIYISYGGMRYLLKTAGLNKFTYQFSQVNQSFDFKIEAEDVHSKPYQVEVMPDPQILNFRIEITPPPYTQIKPVNLENTGDFAVPEGSSVKWIFNTKDIASLWLNWGNKKNQAIKQNGLVYSIELLLKNDIEYTVGAQNSIFLEPELLRFNARVIPDEYPNIYINSLVDSLQPSAYYFKGQTSDDYGISKIKFCYSIDNEAIKCIEIPKEGNGLIQEFYYAYDFKSLMTNGQNLNYHFEVWDNDQVNGSKHSKSQVFSFFLPDQKSIDKLESEQAESLKDKIEASQKLAKDLQKEVKNLKQSMINKDVTDYQATQKLSQLAEKQNQLQRMMEEAAKENEKNNELIKNLSKEDQQLLEKQQQIEDLLNQLMDEEMKKLMDEINKLMKDFNKDEFNKMSEKLDMTYEDLEKQLDRNLEQLKRFEVEKNMQKSIDELRDLAKEHKELSEKTDKASESKEALTKEQEKHQERLDELKKEIDQTFEKNKMLEQPLHLDNPQESIEKIGQEMKQSKQALEQGKSGKASKQQKSNAEQMESLAEQMEQQMQEQMQEKESQDMESIRQLIENLNTFSFQQEATMLELKGIRFKDPRYVQLINQQIKLEENFQLIKDTLYQLAKTQAMLASPINKEILVIDRELDKAQEQLENRQLGQAQAAQQMAMTSANNLSLMLSEAMEQMKKQQCNSQCNKPGSKNKPSGQPKPGFGQPKEQAKSLKNQMQSMLDQLKEGKGSKTGSSGDNQKIGKMIAEQEKLQKMLSDLANSPGISPETAKQLKEIKQISEQIENDLVQKNINPSLLKRQELILTRLLEAENSEFKRDQEQKRESKNDLSPKMSNPKEIFKYKQQNQLGDDFIFRNKVKLSPYYKEKYQNYINKINE